MKAKVLLGMLCVGLLGFAACDKEDDIAATPAPAGVSSNDNTGDVVSPQPNDEVVLEDTAFTHDSGRVADERVNVSGRYVISYFENGIPGGGVDVTSQYQGYVFTIENEKLTVTGNGVNLVGSIRINEDRSVVEILLPPNEKLSDIDPVWFLNDLSPSMIGMASIGMDAPRDAMILSKMPELRTAVQRQ